METTILNLPRKKFAIEKAQSFLRDRGNPNVPIPVKKHLKEYSILYKFEDNEEEAFCVKEASGKYSVYVNRDIMEGRITWTYAHELAHIILGHHDDFNYNSLCNKILDLLDQEVDIFVSEYLMPEYAFDDYFFFKNRCRSFDSPHIGSLKSFFNVSWEAMIIRLHNLGYQHKDESYYYMETYNERKYTYSRYASFSYS